VQRLEAMSPNLLSAIRAVTQAEWLRGEVGFELARALMGMEPEGGRIGPSW
jgi:hypothetical protein